MVLAVYILYWPDNLDFPHSQTLLHRRYQNDIPNNKLVIHNFDEVYKQLKPEERVPFLISKGINYTYVKVANDLMMVAVSKKNINAMLIVVFLHNFYQIMFRYLCNSKNIHNQLEKVRQLDKDVVVDNINVIFELLDECMDFGIIQLTDYNLLKEYIKVEVNLPKGEEEEEEEVKKSKAKTNIKSTKGHAIRDDVLAKQDLHINLSILKTSSLAINWRPKGVFYAKNEIYLDIVEDVHFFYDLGLATIRRNEIYGTCTAICYLSGMPVCQLGFNEENISGIEREHVDRHVERDLKNLLKNEDEEDDEEEELVDGDEKIGSETHGKIPIRNVQFHQCVELASIYNDNLVKFIPPDDTFVLMTYHVEQQKQSRKLPLIMIKPTYRIIAGTNKLQIMCVLTTNFKKRLHCRDLVVQIPLDPNLFSIDPQFDDSNLKFKSELGDVSFKIDTSELFWKFDDITGRKTIKMMAEIQLNDGDINSDTISNHFRKYNESRDNINDPTDQDDSLDGFYGVNGRTGSLITRILESSKLGHDFNNIILSFSIPLLTYSGIKVNYLTVDEEQMKYTCFPWVKYLTRSQSQLKRPENQGQNCYYRFKLGSNCFQVV